MIRALAVGAIGAAVVLALSRRQRRWRSRASVALIDAGVRLEPRPTPEEQWAAHAVAERLRPMLVRQGYGYRGP